MKTINLSLMFESIKNSINTCYDTMINKINEKITNKIVVEINDTTTEFYKSVKAKTVTNLPPKIGYYDETNVPLYGSYNMSYTSISGRADYITTDMEGREITYYLGAKDGLTKQYYFRAYRNNLSNTNIANYSFENEPVTFNKKKITDIIGLENDYLVARLEDGNYYLFDTKFSSNTSIWEIMRPDLKVDEWIKNNDIVSCFFTTYNYNNTGYDTQYILVGVQEYGKQIITHVRTIIINTDSSKKVEGTSYDTISDTSYISLDLSKCKSSEHPDYTYDVSFYDYSKYSIAIANVDTETQCTIVLYANVSVTIYNEKSEAIHNSWGNCKYVNTSKYNKKHGWKSKRISSDRYSEDKWNLSLDDYYDMKNWKIPYSNNGILNVNGYDSVQYVSLCFDKLNKEIYMMNYHRDTYFSQIMMLATNKVDLQTKNCVDFISSSIDCYYSWCTPDTSPWAKKLYAPSLMYNCFALDAESQSYGHNHILFIPETNGDVYEIKAGSWNIQKELDTNIDIHGGSARYCCVRDDSSQYGCTWYCYIRDGNTLKIYNIKVKNRTDKVGNVHNDLCYIDKNSPVDTFTLPNLDLAEYPCGYGWVYVPAKFGTPKFILYAGTYNANKRKVNIDNNGNKTLVSEEGVPHIYVIYHNGTYTRIKTPDSHRQQYINCAYTASPYTPCTMYPYGNAFLDNDGRTIFFDGEYDCFGLVGQYYLKQTKIKLNASYNGLDDFTQRGVGDGGWQGSKTTGYNKQFGYYMCRGGWTTSNFYFYPSLNDLWNGTNVQRKYVINHGSVGLVAYVQSFPIYLGGYYSIVPAQEVYLKPNATNYIYIQRDTANLDEVHLLVYDHLISPENQKGIVFNTLLIAKIETNDGGSTSQKSYNIKYYGNN